MMRSATDTAHPKPLERILEACRCAHQSISEVSKPSLRARPRCGQQRLYRHDAQGGADDVQTQQAHRKHTDVVLPGRAAGDLGCPTTAAAPPGSPVR